MRILFAGHPLPAAGGADRLGEMLAALPAALAARGHEVSVILPDSAARRDQPALAARETGVEFIVQVGSERWPTQILEATAPHGGQIFLVRQEEFFNPARLPDEDAAHDSDRARRVIFFSKAVVELARRLLPAPEIVHVHDWPTALVPVLIKERRLPFRTVLTVHQLAEQGSFWAFDFGLTNLPGHYFSAHGVEFFGQLNLLKGGLVFADRITTDSPPHVQEIQTPPHGCGLDAVLREQAGKLTGILGGLNERLWNPRTDTLLPQNYSASDLTGKGVCRAKLLQESALLPAPRGPVFALATALVATASLALLLPILDRLLSANVRLVIFGPLDPTFARELGIARRRHAGRLAFLETPDTHAAHLLLAGADALLLPGPRELDGFGARAAVKYGTLPIVQATADLDATIRDCDLASATGNALFFHGTAPEALWDAFSRALQLFADPERWLNCVHTALAADFSWSRTAERYEAVYQRALGER